MNFQLKLYPQSSPDPITGPVYRQRYTLYFVYFTLRFAFCPFQTFWSLYTSYKSILRDKELIGNEIDICNLWKYFFTLINLNALFIYRISTFFILISVFSCAVILIWNKLQIFSFNLSKNYFTFLLIHFFLISFQVE